MFLDFLKREENMTYTENGAVTHRTTTSLCLDLFATIGALRSASEQEIVTRFIQAYAENADLAVKTLFFARDIRGGLGERRVFRTILRWLSVNEPESVRKNAGFIAEFGRFDDLLVLLGTPCEQTAIRVIKEQLSADLAAMANGASVSLLAKWLPSVNAHAAETVMNAKRIARALGMSDAKYRKTLSALRGHMEIVENRLRERKYDFAYEKQPSKALYKYRQAFFRNDGERYRAFLNLATSHPSVMHAGTLTPYDVIAPVITKCMAHRAFSEDERQAVDVTWNALPNFVGAENALAVVDGSASMYWGGNGMLPAAVAQSLGIYFAEHNQGAFRGHFITFSRSPRLVEVQGRDIVEKVRYCMSFNECANTDLAKTLELILSVAVHNHLRQKDLPEKLYVISDMEFDVATRGNELTNFGYAKSEFAKHGYELPQIVFWNVASRNCQQPVTKNEQGVCLVSGCTPQIFSMLTKNILDPYSYMMGVLGSARYEKIVA